MITGRQIRAARALLGIDAIDLAQEAGLNRDTVTGLEQGTRQPHRASLEKITHILAQRGIEFTEHEGVRFKSDDIEVFKGREQFHDFTEFVYDHLNRFGGAVCISAVDEKLFRQYRKDIDLYRKRMSALVARGDVTVRILATESNFTSSWAKYKWQPKQSGLPTSFYAFGDCLALVSFAHETPPYVVLLKSGPFAEAYRHAFEIAWNAAKAPPARGRS
jgi:transcriptional regulator with XRE-family HTH domain